MTAQLPVQQPIASAVVPGPGGGRTLAQLAIGEAGVVARVGGARLFRRRLMEMGLIPGTRVRVINVAPLGDPLELEVRGCRISIRHVEAGSVELEPQPPLRVAQ